MIPNKLVRLVAPLLKVISFLSPLSVEAMEPIEVVSKEEARSAIERIVENGSLISESRSPCESCAETYGGYQLTFSDNAVTYTYEFLSVEDFRREIAKRKPLVHIILDNEGSYEYMQDLLRIRITTEEGSYWGFANKGADTTIEEGVLEIGEEKPCYISEYPDLRDQFKWVYRKAIEKIIERFPLSRKERIKEAFRTSE